MRRPGFMDWFGCLCVGVLLGGLLVLTNSSLGEAATTLTPVQTEVVRSALHQALALQFEEALATATNLEENEEPTLVSQLTRGMIAYFQARWQTRQYPAARQSGHRALTTLLEKGQPKLKRSPEDRWLLLILGTAAVIDAILRQNDAPLESLPRFSQGRIWLQQALVQHEDTADAHLGLGLLYFADTALAGSISRILRSSAEDMGSTMAIHHLQRASEKGQFSQEVAQTFLLRVYELEQRYDEAIQLALQLQATFPENGYYALRAGSAQCALARYADCAATLGALVSRHTRTPKSLGHRSDRFDLFYQWGVALTELGLHGSAFRAYRKAINQDPSVTQDETLWAKFQVARHYERRQQYKTARQFYQTLLRRRNVDDLHQRINRRLRSLP